MSEPRPRELAVRRRGVVRRAALPHHAQLPLPLPQRADHGLRRLLDQVGGVAHRFPRVIDEPCLRPLPPRAQPGGVAEQRLVQAGRGRQRLRPHAVPVRRQAGSGARPGAGTTPGAGHGVRLGRDAVVRPEGRLDRVVGRAGSRRTRLVRHGRDRALRLAVSSGAGAGSGTAAADGSLGLAVNVGRGGGAVSSSAAGATMLPIPVVNDRPSSSAGLAVAA